MWKNQWTCNLAPGRHVNDVQQHCGGAGQMVWLNCLKSGRGEEQGSQFHPKMGQEFPEKLS